MATVHARIRLAVAAMVFFIFAAAAAPLAAQQPNSVDPNAAAVHEQQLLQQSDRIQGLGSIADTKSYVIEQPLGRVWRQFHEVWLRWIAIIVIVGVVALLAAVYFTLGPIWIEAGRSGHMIARFKSYERVTHWMTATSFVILAGTGLNITFGRMLLLPLIGPQAFSYWSLMAKYAHNFSSFPFVLGVVILFLLWAKPNIPTALDIAWFKAGGGMIGHIHAPAEKFNGGQKLLFWLAMLGTAGAAISGAFLLFPFYWTNIMGMQIAQVLHALIAVAFIATIIGHIYIGAIGMEGGWEAMATGQVDLNWAKQHHSLWVERELGQGRDATAPAGATPTPAA